MRYLAQLTVLCSGEGDPVSLCWEAGTPQALEQSPQASLPWCLEGLLCHSHMQHLVKSCIAKPALRPSVFPWRPLKAPSRLATAWCGQGGMSVTSDKAGFPPWFYHSVWCNMIE